MTTFLLQSLNITSKSADFLDYSKIGLNADMKGI